MEKYTILNQIGQGGMGSVYKAKDASGRVVALKVLKPQAQQDEKSIKRFLNEGKAIAKLRHANIVEIYHVDMKNGKPFLAMEYVEGQTWEDLIKNNELSLKQSLKILSKVLVAMDYIHREGIIHRDLKPSNIMIDLDGEPRIMDFGLAKIMDSDDKLTKTGEVLGTPLYMPPEQFKGKGIDHRSDLYTLGVMLYEICTKVHPFAGKTTAHTITRIIMETPPPPHEINPDIPHFLSEVCLKAINKDKGLRYQSAKSFARALKVNKRPRKTSANNFKLTATTAAVVITVSIALLLVFSHGKSSTKQVSKTPNDKDILTSQKTRAVSSQAKKFFENSLQSFDKRDYNTARDFLEKAIALHPNYAIFQVQKAKMYFLGHGYEENDKKCLQIIKKHYKNLQKLNDGYAYYLCAMTQYYGLGGQRDIALAEKFFLKGARARVNRCYRFLSDMYFNDPQKSTTLFREFAKTNDVHAMLYLARSLVLTSNYKSAKLWLVKARNINKRFTTDQCAIFAFQNAKQKTGAPIKLFLDFALQQYPDDPFYLALKSRFTKTGQIYKKDPVLAKQLAQRVQQTIDTKSYRTIYSLTAYAWLNERILSNLSNARELYLQAIQAAKYIEDRPYFFYVNMMWGANDYNVIAKSATISYKNLVAHMEKAIYYDTRLCVRLGLAYFKGVGVKQNTQRAIEVWKIAAKAQRNAGAILHLGQIYLWQDEGVATNLKTATHYFSQLQRTDTKQRARLQVIWYKIHKMPYDLSWQKYTQEIKTMNFLRASTVLKFIQAKKAIATGNTQRAINLLENLYAKEKQKPMRTYRYSYYTIPIKRDLAIAYKKQGKTKKAIEIMESAIAMYKKASILYIVSPEMQKQCKSILTTWKK
ncbi:serine/threonine-protein kinase [Candidatus Uabimicrobium amorphum]|uniref:non-specific serine/threonine protein kinase n=1 Tax=Uabimicrobium amorphum TaxID=2596890 RepID=A0A5S9ISN6_UABAM|nr:serine/threonine-protein kinase [Candidatus Uabimicrobium amorphum]BBM87017.1 serine/threonine protein kinase [Candidatus Uabimicrobium amorphum]